MEGKQVGHYKILEKLGSGGMGEVWLAEDTRLGRKVALKFLPAGIDPSDEEQKRFLREAQAASALDHNNICTIYEIGNTDDERSYISMAYYSGETLNEMTAKGPLSLGKAVGLALQIADGLACAHRAGIIHRDLKPANVIITNDGVAKILDFGLAKLVDQTELTIPGTALGTAAYMSPEQARGSGTDQRTDVWSLGVIVYEMLTGRKLFAGDNPQAVIYQILNSDQDYSLVEGKGFPDDLAQILRRALHKDPGQRYPSVDLFAADLEALGVAESPSGRIAVHRINSWVNSVWFMVLGGVVALGLAYILLFGSRADYFQVSNPQPLTRGLGLEDGASWSPDFTQVAYMSDEDGDFDIWVHQIESGARRNLTSDFEGWDGGPVWSPENDWIAFLSTREGGGIYKVPPFGGEATRIMATGSFSTSRAVGVTPGITWSPDGQYLAVAGGDRIVTIRPNGEDYSVIYQTPVRQSLITPHWSADGEWIAFSAQLGTVITSAEIWLIRPDGSDAWQVTRGEFHDRSPFLSDDIRRIYYLSNQGGGVDVFSQSIDPENKTAAEPERVTSLYTIGSYAPVESKRRIVYSLTSDRSNIFSLPRESLAQADLADARPVTAENQIIESVHTRPGLDEIAYDSSKPGNVDIYLVNVETGISRRLIQHPDHDYAPNLSHDGTAVAFHRNVDGNRDIWIKQIGGGPAYQVTFAPGTDWFPKWSPDDRELTFWSDRAGNYDVWTLELDTRKLKQLTFGESSDASGDYSLDGGMIIFRSKRDSLGTIDLYEVPRMGGTVRRITRMNWRRIGDRAWSIDGKTLYIIAGDGPGAEGDNLWAVSYPGGHAELVLKGTSPGMGIMLSLTSDGENIYFPVWESAGDLYLADLIFP